MSEAEFAPRLHVILARAADTAIVFRRGPSKRVASFLWDRANDTFTLGQWLKGRIYERRADLSPDGKHLIYFAYDPRKSSQRRDSWTAVSRAPYLKALDLYGNFGCWEGGGLFLDNQRYWFNNRYFDPAQDTLRQASGLERADDWRPAQQFGAECTGVYYPRLLRDGWTLIDRSEAGAWNSGTTFEKPLTGGWTLRKIAHEQVDHPPGKGCYWDMHELRHTPSLRMIPCPDWEWADWDRGTLVWAEHGKLYRSNLSADGVSPQLLHDFAPYTFEARKAPYDDEGWVPSDSPKARKRRDRKDAKRKQGKRAAP